MANSERQLLEDRALRDAARDLVHSDIGFIRESIGARGLPARVASRVTGSAREIADEAAAVAEENRTVLAAGLVLGTLGLGLWIFREPVQHGADDLWKRARKLLK